MVQMAQGSQEAKVKKAIKKAKVQKVILNTIFTAGVLSVAVLAPNALKALKIFDGGNKRKKDPKYVISNSISRLEERGYIIFENIGGKNLVRLTKKGEARLQLIEKHDFNIKKPKKWDGKWRIIIFDVKESRKHLRNKLRLTLISIGFIRLQDSVWVYPYPCEDLIVLLKADFKMGKEVLYMIVDSIENDKWLRESFGLPRLS